MAVFKPSPEPKVVIWWKMMDHAFSLATIRIDAIV